MFWRFFAPSTLLRKTKLLWFLPVYPVRNVHSLFLMGLNPLAPSVYPVG